VKRRSGWANGPVTFLGLALVATFVELAVVAQLFADYTNSAFA
jgi:hypothetical protein